MPAPNLIPPAVLAALLLAAPPAVAVDSLGVAHRFSQGQVVSTYTWPALMDSSHFVHVARDSIWVPPVRPGADLLGPDSGLRQSAYVIAETLPGAFGMSPLTGGNRMFDDDGATAYAPDSLGHPLGRAVYIDLGAVAGIDRLRFFPRLDRRHTRLFLQEFTVATSATSFINGFETLVSFSSNLPNVEAVVDRTVPSRLARYVRIAPASERPYEIAEVEVFADGTTPVALFDTVPLRANLATAPIYGRIRFEGGSIADADVIVHTRTGPDDKLRHYFRSLVEGSNDPADLERVEDAEAYFGLPREERGPVLPNPAWSPWRTVADGLVRSPGLDPFIQLRILFPISGVTLRRIVVEYLRQAIFRDLPAEVWPTVVEPGVPTDFTLSAVAFLDTAGRNAATGFRILDVGTVAEVLQVHEVLVDDVPVAAGRSVDDTGFRVFLSRRIVDNGTFLQVRFRAAVYQDFTSFTLTAVDNRLVSGVTETAVQTGRPGDVDDQLEGGALVVRFADGAGRQTLTDVTPATPVFTPNGDGVNDVFAVDFTLLRVFDPVDVGLEIRDLRGHLVGQVAPVPLGAGRHRLTWPPLAAGAPPPPGIYLYTVRADAADGIRVRHGTVAVAY